MRLWMLKTPSAFQFVELAAFRLLASSDHGQPYNNVAQISSNRHSKSSGDGAEIIALRHQLIVLQRTQKANRLVLGRTDRCLCVWLSRLWSRWRSALIIVKP